MVISLKKKIIIISSVLLIVLVAILLCLFVFKTEDKENEVNNEYLYNTEELLFASIDLFNKEHNIEININNNGNYEISAILKNKTIAKETQNLSKDSIDAIKNEIKNINFRNLKSHDQISGNTNIYNIKVYFIDKDVSINNILESDTKYESLIALIYDTNNDFIKMFNEEIDKYYDSVKKQEKQKEKQKEIKKETKKETNNSSTESSSNNDYSYEKKSDTSSTTTKNNNNAVSKNETETTKKDETISCKGKPIYSWMRVDYKTLDECMNVASSYNDGVSRSCYEIVDCTGAVLGFALDY